MNEVSLGQFVEHLHYDGLDVFEVGHLSFPARRDVMVLIEALFARRCFLRGYLSPSVVRCCFIRLRLSVQL